jgi:hypothetical protein
LGDAPANTRSPHQTLNQVLGILVFLAGVGLLLFVFYSAYQLYVGISSETFGAQPATQQVAVSGASPTFTPAPGSVRTSPEKSPSLVALLATFAAKLVALLVLGWLAGMLAGKGAAMTRQVIARE